MDINTLLGDQVNAFTLPVQQDEIDTIWAFERHHLVYATKGLFIIEAKDAIWRLPPTRAAWIPAHVAVHTVSQAPVEGFSVFFHRNFVELQPFSCRVFPVTPLVREMIVYSERWSGTNEQDDPMRKHFYASLGYLCNELFQNISVLYLPKPQSYELMELFEYVLKHLDQPLTLPAVADLINLSPRTTARRLQDEMHLSWSQFLHRARMTRALDLLASGHTVTETALTVGFQSLTAFSTAFRKFAGVSPKQYQQQSL